MSDPVAALRDQELVDLLRDDPDLLAIADAIAATAPRRTRRSRTIVALGAAIVCAASVAVAPAFGVHFGPIDFWAAPNAPHTARTTFNSKTIGLRGLDVRRLNIGATRRIAVEQFRGERMRLFVAPLRAGGFCYVWALKPDDTGVWINEMGGCGIPGQPLAVSFDDTRLSLVADASRIDRIALTLSNGHVVYPPVHWVSAPVNSGFVLYQPPTHLYVTGVEGLRGDAIVTTEPINDGKQLFGGSR